MKRVKEIIKYIYGDVEVYIMIDYINNKFSLVEKPLAYTETTGVKKYVFAERGIEYMNGWLNVLEGVQYAIRSAKERYEIYMKEQEKEKLDSAASILEVATDIVKGRKNKKTKK